MNEGILWHQDPPFVADYMDFYMDKSKRILGVGSDNTNIKVLGATNGPIPLKVGNRWFLITSDVVVDTATDLDTGSIRAGTDYYVYLCDNNGVADYVISLNSTYPAGYTANNSRKIGGFHTLSADVGTISGHSLSGFVAKDILPASIWCLKHRAKNLNNAGLVYDDRTQLWVQIYLASANGATSVQSVNGATILDMEDWNSFVERGGVAGMRLLSDAEFQIAVRGTNEETNITGSTDPITTGGHLDTAGRRMISNIGLEDTCGAMHQWLLDQSYRFDISAANISLSPAGARATVYHEATPGGNQVYLKFSNSGIPYLCSNMATDTADVWITLGTNQKFIIKHDANASDGGIAVYMDLAAADPGKLLINNTVHGKNVYVSTNYDGAVVVQLVHDASAATNGVALYYDDGTDNRLEATFPNGANNTFDSAYFSPAFSHYNLPGVVGSLLKQGNLGDIKLLAGGYWSSAVDAGSRCRSVNYHRGVGSTSVGGRFACEPL